MNIDEAIQHCYEVANSKCDLCGAEHRQLAEWLKELKEYRNYTINNQSLYNAFGRPNYLNEERTKKMSEFRY